MSRQASYRWLIGNEKGGIPVKALFWILVFIIGLYSAYKFAPPELEFYMFKTDIDEEAKIAHMYSDEALAKRIFQKAETWNVPIDADSLQIERGAYDITITADYTITLDFFGKYQRERKYHIFVQRPLKEAGRVL